MLSHEHELIRRVRFERISLTKDIQNGFPPEGGILLPKNGGENAWAKRTDPP